LALARELCEQDHLFFTRYFFKARQGNKFIVNWHHRLMADAIDGVITGKIKNLVVEVSPGSTKTETFVINFIARGLAINPRARFLHLSGSDTLASLNSQTARDIVQSDEYQQFWPMKIAEDSSSKKRWNVMVGGQIAGGCYATALGGQVTGFRAGHMAEGFQGAILIDDPIKPEDAFSKPKVDAANRKLLTTVKSRRATPDTPIVLVMQRLGPNDPAGFVRAGNLPGQWTFIRIPAVLGQADIDALEPKYRALIPESETIDGRRSYWPYKEPIAQLLEMERGEGADQTGARISRYVFASQYNQAPVVLGGNILKGEHFRRYAVLPKLKWRKIFADTAQKTKERNDFSVLGEFGLGVDGLLYLVDLERGKWEAPELQRRTIAFWAKCKARDVEHYGQLRKLKVEDKSSGTGLIQTIRLPPYNIPVEAVERNKDKLTRVMDAQPYIEVSQVCVPEDAPFTSDFISECEAFTADDTHEFDDQIDVLVDAVDDMLQAGNKLKQWAALGAPQTKDTSRSPNNVPAENRIIAKFQKTHIIT